MNDLGVLYDASPKSTNVVAKTSIPILSKKKIPNTTISKEDTRSSYYHY